MLGVSYNILTSGTEDLAFLPRYPADVHAYSTEADFHSTDSTEEDDFSCSQAWEAPDDTFDTSDPIDSTAASTFSAPAPLQTPTSASMRNLPHLLVGYNPFYGFTDSFNPGFHHPQFCNEWGFPSPSPHNKLFTLEHMANFLTNNNSMSTLPPSAAATTSSHELAENSTVGQILNFHPSGLVGNSSVPLFAPETNEAKKLVSEESSSSLPPPTTVLSVPPRRVPAAAVSAAAVSAAAAAVSKEAGKKRKTVEAPMVQENKNKREKKIACVPVARVEAPSSSSSTSTSSFSSSSSSRQDRLTIAARPCDFNRYTRYLEDGESLCCERCPGCPPMSLRKFYNFDGHSMKRFGGCCPTIDPSGNHMKTVCTKCQAIFIDNFRCHHQPTLNTAWTIMPRIARQKKEKVVSKSRGAGGNTTVNEVTSSTTTSHKKSKKARP